MGRSQPEWPSEDTEPGDLRGRWVALDNCRYDGCTGQPVEGNVVDSDEDLAELCARLNAAGRSRCTIIFCDDDLIIAPSNRPSSSFSEIRTAQ
jgi:hypothetical protein